MATGCFSSVVNLRKTCQRWQIIVEILGTWNVFRGESFTQGVWRDYDCSYLGFIISAIHWYTTLSQAKAGVKYTASPVNNPGSLSQQAQWPDNVDWCTMNVFSSLNISRASGSKTRQPHIHHFLPPSSSSISSTFQLFGLIASNNV